jgi:hypothetical protein
MTVAWLIHWNAGEAPERRARLERAGYEARFEDGGGTPLLRRIREDPPDVVVIDLSRLPSHGREMAGAIRRSKATRSVPLVFVDGAPEKVAVARDQFPDAVFATWRGIGGAVGRAIRSAPKDPRVPRPYMERFAGRPLRKKLGIDEGDRVGLLGAPDDFATTLGTLPKGTTLSKGARGRCDPILCFVQSQTDLFRRLDALTKRGDLGGVWLVWPKKTSSVATDLTQQAVRDAGLAAGLVDHKICRVDETWSALRFVRRR